MTASLFNSGAFKLHSGKETDFKIDCDALSDQEIEVLAHVAAPLLPRFGEVHGVPRGGLRIADALVSYGDLGSPTNILIVDDVLTTGNSFWDHREYLQDKWERRWDGTPMPDPNFIGLVLFARGPCPDWVRPLFTYIKESNNDRSNGTNQH